MRRIGNLYEQICSLENLRKADQCARKNKSKQYGVQHHIKNEQANILKLHLMLKNKTFATSAYTTFFIYEPKEREIFRLPYFPDRIVHHAIMIILEPMFVACFTQDTYSCIKGRGIHAAQDALETVLRKDVAGTEFWVCIPSEHFIY